MGPDIDIDSLINELIDDLNNLNWDKIDNWGQEGLLHHHKPIEFATIMDVGWRCIVWQTDKCEGRKNRGIDMYAYIVVQVPHWAIGDLK